MNTCRNCGCYIPDNWKICPGCNQGITGSWVATEDTEHRYIERDIVNVVLPKDFVGEFKAVVTYDRGHTNVKYFRIYEDAVRFAHQNTNLAHVVMVEIFWRGKRTGVWYGKTLPLERYIHSRCKDCKFFENHRCVVDDACSTF